MIQDTQGRLFTRIVCHSSKACSGCCRESANVVLTPDELPVIMDLARIRNIPTPLVETNDEQGLIVMAPQHGRCVFFSPSKNTCVIHKDKPLFCQLYPIWLTPKGPIIDVSCPIGDFFRNLLRSRDKEMLTLLQAAQDLLTLYPTLASVQTNAIACTDSVNSD